MKTITDDPEGFFDQGGWSFLDPDSDAEGDDEDESGDDDHYAPTDEDVEGEESESDFSGESDVTESDPDISGKLLFFGCYQQIV